jgi:cytoskeletal protein RodZ
MTLRDIADSTKISMAALNAIEHNDFDRLPGGLFRRAYLRAFATEVGLDANVVAQTYRAQCEPRTIESRPPPRTNLTGDRRRFLGAALVMTFVAFAFAAAIMSRPDEVGAPQVAHLVESAVRANVPSPAGPANESHPTKDIAFAAAATEDHSLPLVLELRVMGWCWVSAEADGARVVYRLMQPGERHAVHARVAITLRVGNAGTVGYSINGMPGRPLGRRGQPVTVRITGDNYEGFFAAPAGATPDDDAGRSVPHGVPNAAALPGPQAPEDGGSVPRAP